MIKIVPIGLLEEDQEADQFYRGTIASYDRCAARYAAQNDSIDEVKDLLTFFDEQIPCTASLLDVGCGHGRDVEYLSSLGHMVYGIDRSEKLLRMACGRVPKSHFVEGDVRVLPFRDASFDGLWMNAVLHHLIPPHMPQSLTECRRVLKPSGLLFVSVHLDDSSGWQSKGADFVRYYARMSGAMLTGLLQDAGLTPIRMTSRSAESRWLHCFARPGTKR
ncbi:class I SAM-dependent methyltransferase [Streptomyces pseudovenezuelae]|uniref:Class I SAM-dependent methyltransferase n=1 Tax=Streptomyces pseudovenezuelae TaxID=67350 RepID=A0ABZ1XAT6_9ACTN|nr:class I SAM-dependent methyltransferase [Streptomyces pseudovenezuelae]